MTYKDLAVLLYERLDMGQQCAFAEVLVWHSNSQVSDSLKNCSLRDTKIAEGCFACLCNT